MKKFAFFVCLVFSFVFTHAQTIISGVVKNTEGEKVVNASIILEEEGKTAIIAYAITDSKGAFKLNVNSSASQFKVSVKAFNHEPASKKISNSSQTVNFKLSAKTTEIKEVIIKSKLITKKGDTISYNLNKFASKNDRTLADVLKKMPGVEVKKDGTILYQGEPLSKFYVEGKDLMEGGYGLINNSLPKDAVSSVEIMENHQPVKILKDKVPSDRAAINIKLKRKITMTGRGEVGVGLSPLLWNVKLTPMFFSKKNQWVANYKTNNVGEEVEKEDNILSFGNRFEGRRSMANQNGWLNVENASIPSIPVKRYLMNNVHYVSANLLTSPFNNKDWELKANASYSNNTIERVSNYTAKYITGTEVIRNINNDFYTNQAKAELIFSKNADKSFFKNITSLRGYWNTDRADVYRKDNVIGEANADESTYSPTVNFTNSLSTIIPIKEKLVNFQSYVSYQKDKQNLRVKPADYTLNSLMTNSNELKQNFDLQTLEVNHNASLSFSYNKWTFTPEVGLNLNYKVMESTTTTLDNSGNYNYISSAYKNDNSWNTLTPKAEFGVNYKSDNFRMFLRLPANFNSVKYKDHLRGISKDLNKTTFEPSFFASYEFASFFKLMGFGSINNSFGDISSIYEGFIVTSPSSIIAKESPMPETKSQSIGSKLEYRNPLNNLFFNIRYNYSSFNRNVISQFNPGAVNIFKSIALDTETHSQSQSVEVGKYFPKFKTNASVSFSNSDGNSYSYFTDLRENKTNGQSLNFKFNNTYLNWFSLDYLLSYSWDTTKTPSLNISNKSTSWEHDLSAYVYPSDNHTFGFIWNQRSTKFDNRTFSNPFFDLSYQYTWTKKKIDFEFKWMNIANTKYFERVNVSNDGTLSTTKINIRPSQFMFTVKFNFK